MASDLTNLPTSQYDYEDALFMGLAGWTRWATRTGNSAYLDKMDALYTWTRDRAPRVRAARRARRLRPVFSIRLAGCGTATARTSASRMPTASRSSGRVATAG